VPQRGRVNARQGECLEGCVFEVCTCQADAVVLWCFSLLLQASRPAMADAYAAIEAAANLLAGAAVSARKTHSGRGVERA